MAQNTNSANKDNNLILSMCATINMNGCAAFILLTTLFVSAANNYNISFPWGIVNLLGVSGLLAAGNAAVPMGCFFMASYLLISMGVSTELMGVIMIFHPFLDMIETAVNVFSDQCIAAIVNKRNE